MAKNSVHVDYRKAMWDRLDDIAYPGEHQNLFGHDAALELFSTSYKSGRMHHAWLICGPKGVGKATFSLAVAGHVLRNPDPALAPPSWINAEPDDVIASKIGKGGHPNVLHLSRPFDDKTRKFKTSLTIDEIRRTIGFFGTTAGVDNWRICIVDTADNMNTSAANALLKILEEPPARTLFLVLSSSPGLLLPTIRSRCRQLSLRPLDIDALNNALLALGIDIDCVDEGDKNALHRLSNGSVRKAIILMQQDGLKIYRRFKEILEQGQSDQPDWLGVHRLADELSRKNKEDHYQLLFDIVQQHISDALHFNAANSTPKHSISRLARMCEVWEKTTSSVSLTQRYNLDKKQVIINLFGSLAQVR